MSRVNSILETVGRTPVVRINKLAPAHVSLYVKIEAFNPLGSVKDRLALGVKYQDASNVARWQHAGAGQRVAGDHLAAGHHELAHQLHAVEAVGKGGGESEHDQYDNEIEELPGQAHSPLCDAA